MFFSKFNAIIEKCCLVIIFSSFLIALYLYLANHIRYAGVESWPSVDIDLVDQNQSVITSSSGASRSGIEGTSITSSTITAYHYFYTVNGKQYEGVTTSPNGDAELPSHWKRTELKNGVSLKRVFEYRAHYKPSDPSIAVLVPEPYRGILPLIIITLSACFIAPYLRKKWRKNGRIQNKTI